jgi:hypothetical protein
MPAILTLNRCFAGDWCKDSSLCRYSSARPTGSLVAYTTSTMLIAPQTAGRIERVRSNVNVAWRNAQVQRSSVAVVRCLTVVSVPASWWMFGSGLRSLATSCAYVCVARVSLRTYGLGTVLCKVPRNSEVPTHWLSSSAPAGSRVWLLSLLSMLVPVLHRRNTVLASERLTRPLLLLLLNDLALYFHRCIQKFL